MADHGEYMCTASNELGENSAVVILEGTSEFKHLSIAVVFKNILLFSFLFLGKPEAPTDLEFINSTHNTVTLKWVEGFNGGAEQIFQVRFQEAEDETVHYQEAGTVNMYQVQH